MTDEKSYPDFEALPFGGMRKIERLPRMERTPPDISWGREFESWPERMQLSYAKRLASTMNHAADILQGERNALIEVCERQERQIVSLREQLEHQNSMTHAQLQRVGAEKQPLYQQIVDQKAKIRALALRVRELEGS